MPQVTTPIFGLLYRFTICNKANIRYNHRHGSQSNEELRRSWQDRHSGGRAHDELARLPSGS